MMTKTPVCPICGRARRLTDEDIIPKWARTMVLTEIGNFPASQMPPRIRTRICGQCNGASNDRFEIPAKPLLLPMMRNEGIRLTPRQQAIVSGWIIKTHTLSLFHDARDQDPIRQALRVVIKDLIETGNPIPSTSMVRLGRFDIRSPKGMYSPHLAKLLPPTIPTVQWHATQAIGHAAWHVVGGDPVTIGQLVSVTEDNDWLVRIWPPRTTDVEWPPPRALTYSDMYGIHFGFDLKRTPGSPPSRGREWVSKPDQP